MNKPGRILLLTYYWPPAGGVAVQRWLSMSYYLANMGWAIEVITTGNPDYPYLDSKLQSKVHPNIKIHKVSGMEPRLWLKRLRSITGQSNTSENLDNMINNPDHKPGLMTRAIMWIRSNLFIPDARVGWAKAAGIYAIKQWGSSDFDYVITTGPPHSTHLSGLRLRATWPTIRWIADFRDPWMEIEFFDHLNLTKAALKKHEQLEHDVLSKAHTVLTVSPSWARLFEKKGAVETAVIFNGYDHRDYKRRIEKKASSAFRVIHLGTWGQDRSVPAFFKALNEVADTNKRHCQLEWAGILDPLVHEEMKKVFTSPYVHLVDHGFVAHQSAVALSQEANVLLLIQNQAPKNIKGRIPAKCFEYMASGQPLLLIGREDTDMADIVSKHPLGYFAAFDDDEAMRQHLKEIMNNQKPPHNQEELSIEWYSRKAQSEQLHQLLMRKADQS